MNFSIAYGKTAIGFAQDWNCSIDEAEVFNFYLKKTISAWYSDRKEVIDWQI